MRGNKKQTELPPVGGNSFSRALLLISATALVLRLIISWEIASANGGVNNVFAPPQTSDLATYISLAENTAAGKLPEVFYYQPYYYTVFLAVIFFFAGSFAIHTTIVVQAVLSALTVFLTGKCAEKIFGRRAGIISAIMCAVSVPLLLYVPFCQNETLQTFHLVLLLFCTLWALEKKRWYCWGVCGVIAGIAILTRGNVWLLLPAIIGPMIIVCCREKITWKRSAGFFMIFVVMLFAVQMPFIIYNSVKCGKLTGPSTAADAVLALGNTPEAPAGGRDAGLGAGAMYYPEAFHRMMKLTVGDHGKSIPYQMWEWFCDEPLAFLELQFRKALLFWDSREIPNNVSLEYDGFCSVLLKWDIVGRSIVLLPLGLAGVFWFLWRLFHQRDEKIIVLYGFIVLFYISVILFYILSRFRAPLLPLLFTAGGGFVADAYGWFKDKREREKKEHLLGMFCVLLFSVLIVSSGYDFYRYYLESPIMGVIRPDGVRLDAGGENVQYFDHGPMPWGGWIEIPAENGMILSKKFSGLSEEQGRVQIMVRNIEPGEIMFSVNDAVFNFKLPAAQIGKSPNRRIVFPAELSGGKVDVKVAYASGGVVVLADRQRDYGRSFCNNKPIEAEWVMRFEVMKKRAE